jgi:flagellar biosynthesis protein FlhA
MASVAPASAFSRNIEQGLKTLQGSRDILLGVGVLGILMMLIFPLPAWLLDFCLALSITI